MNSVSSLAAADESTLVHTARGVLPLARVVAGDIAFGLDERVNDVKPYRIDDISPAGVHQLLAITVATQTVLVTGAACLLALVDRRREGRQRRRFRREWVQAKDLEVGDLVALALKTPDLGTPHRMTTPVPRGVQLRRSNRVELPVESNEDLMWFAGVFVGDGWIDNDRGSKAVNIAIPRSDQPLRDELSATTERLFGLGTRSKTEWTVGLNSFRVADYLEANGIRGNAHTKRIPDWVSTIPEGQRLAFLGGYVDADGHVASSRKNKGMSLTSANRELLEDARRLAATCGLRFGAVYRFAQAGPDRGEAYRAWIHGDFDRIACRSPQRTSRLRKRQYQRNFTSTGTTCFRVHTNEWLGFASVKAIVPTEGPTVTLTARGSNLVAERLIVRFDQTAS